MATPLSFTNSNTETINGLNTCPGQWSDRTRGGRGGDQDPGWTNGHRLHSRGTGEIGGGRDGLGRRDGTEVYKEEHCRRALGRQQQSGEVQQEEKLHATTGNCRNVNVL